jgi:hypothetical protein
MPDRQITELKLLMASPYELEITEEDLQPGEKIMIKAGPFKGNDRRNGITTVAKAIDIEA